MQITQRMQITPKEFHRFLLNNVKEDILEANPNQQLPDDVSHYQYHKQLAGNGGKAQLVDVEIEVCREGEYKTILKSAQGTYTLKYCYDSIDECWMEVKYQEEYHGVSSSAQISYQLFSFVGKRKNKKRMQHLLQAMETKIIEERVIA